MEIMLMHSQMIQANGPTVMVMAMVTGQSNQTVISSLTTLHSGAILIMTASVIILTAITETSVQNYTASLQSLLLEGALTQIMMEL